MPSAVMDTRIRGYDKKLVTPDLIGGLWLLTLSPPAWSGVHAFGRHGYPHSRVWQNIGHPRPDRGSM